MHAYLPKLKAGTENKFTVPNKAGVWDPHSNSHLHSLATAIEVPPEARRIYSIPDPWARALLFDHALYNPEHPLHALTLQEWRGALALLALKERRTFDRLDIKQVSLSQPRPGSFAHVVARLLPNNPADFLADHTGWDEFYILRWQGRERKAFAFTSPMTLVCTGADYSNALTKEEIPWFNGLTLGDPIPSLSPKERTALAQWILGVSSGLGQEYSQSSRRNSLQRLLQAFAADLAAEAKPENPDKLLSTINLGLTKGVFRLIARPLVAEVDPSTDIEIVTSRPGAPRFLLIEPSLDRQWNVAAREIRIQDGKTLATASQITATGRSSDKFLDGSYWCTAAHFFADRLIYEQGETASFPGCLAMKVSGDPRKRTAVFPLNPALLDLFTAKDLAEMVSLEWLPDGGARCHIRVRLRSTSGVERVCSLSKDYSDGAAGSMTRVASLPLLCVWPNFQLKDKPWKVYYTFQFWQKNMKKELAVTPWTSAEPGRPAGEREHELDERRFRVFRSSAYPEAYRVETPYFDEKAMRNINATGLLLVDRPQEIKPTGAQEIVMGIDFGSTGSNVYWKRGGNKPSPVPFEDRIHRITDFDKKEFRRVTYRLFLPAEQRSAESVLSIFHDFGDPDGGDLHRVVLQDGHVLFVDDPESFIEGDPNRVLSNLKWGGVREQIAARDFLMQLCLQAAAESALEGATKVDLRFSYPTAFSNADRRRFEDNWKVVAESAKELTGVNFELNAKIDAREAVVATNFFQAADKPFDVIQGALTIDIGGGTSDIAVWRERELLAHTSVLIAGRDLLQAPLRRMPTVLSDIDRSVRIDQLSPTSTAAMNAQIDALVASRGPALMKALPLKASLPQVAGLLRLMETGLCGIAYFAGLMVRDLRTRGVFEPGRTIGIFVGGNGSKIFQWCARNNFSNDSDLHDAVALSFRTGAGLPASHWVEFNLSDRPKEEVAYGLVVAPHMDAGQRRPVPVSSFMGESFSVLGQQREWTETLPLDAIRDRKLRVDRTLPMFREFLEALGRPMDERTTDQLGAQIDLHFHKLANDIEEAARRNKGKAEDSIQHEPMFIVALKKYLEGEINAWARKS